MTALRVDAALKPMPDKHLQRRLTVVGAVIGLHLAALWALQTGLLRRVVEVVIPVQVLAEIIEPAQPLVPPAPPAPPPPQPPPRPPEAPARPRPVLRTEPEPLPVQPAEPAPAAPQVSPPDPAPPAPAAAAPASPAPTAAPAPPPPPPVQLPSSSADYLNNPRPAYPPMSQRLGEEGMVVVRVFIEADGRASRAEVLRSSGFERLDKTAVDTALRWRYVPGKRAGVPEAMWVNVPIDFKLNR